ncbi:MAG: hypothetical protein KIT27_09355 [Legionellales bacterium]|nr:hypothetical protein [Legionellales bacterium]
MNHDFTSWLNPWQHFCNQIDLSTDTAQGWLEQLEKGLAQFTESLPKEKIPQQPYSAFWQIWMEHCQTVLSQLKVQLTPEFTYQQAIELWIKLSENDYQRLLHDADYQQIIGACVNQWLAEDVK